MMLTSLHSGEGVRAGYQLEVFFLPNLEVSVSFEDIFG